MASFINATIDDHKFDALIEVMNNHAVHLKPVVLSRLIKSPYKTYIQNIPLFMRVRKRFDAEKIRKIG